MGNIYKTFFCIPFSGKKNAFLTLVHLCYFISQISTQVTGNVGVSFSPFQCLCSSSSYCPNLGLLLVHQCTQIRYRDLCWKNVFGKGTLQFRYSTGTQPHFPITYEQILPGCSQIHILRFLSSVYNWLDFRFSQALKHQILYLDTSTFSLQFFFKPARLLDFC